MCVCVGVGVGGCGGPHTRESTTSGGGTGRALLFPLGAKINIQGHFAMPQAYNLSDLDRDF